MFAPPRSRRCDVNARVSVLPRHRFDDKHDVNEPMTTSATRCGARPCRQDVGPRRRVCGSASGMPGAADRTLHRRTGVLALGDTDSDGQIRGHDGDELPVLFAERVRGCAVEREGAQHRPARVLVVEQPMAERTRRAEPGGRGGDPVAPGSRGGATGLPTVMATPYRRVGRTGSAPLGNRSQSSPRTANTRAGSARRPST